MSKIFPIIYILLLTQTLLIAKVDLKDGNYSWFKGDSQAFISITKMKNNLYHIKGDCYYGVGRKYGPNMGGLEFNATLRDGKITYNEPDSNYTFILTVHTNKSFQVDDTSSSDIFGLNASFYGLYTSENTPSFSCNKGNSFVEKTICSNPKLAKLDKNMAMIYTQYKSAFFFEKNKNDLEKKLNQVQEIWLKNRNSCKYQKDVIFCLQQSYQKRIETLENQFNSFWRY